MFVVPKSTGLQANRAKTGLGLVGAAALATYGGRSSHAGGSRKTIRIWDAYPDDYPSAQVMQEQVWDRFLADHPGFELEYTAGLDPTEIASRFATR